MKYSLLQIIAAFVWWIFTSILIIYIIGCNNIFFLHNEENHESQIVTQQQSSADIIEDEFPIIEKITDDVLIENDKITEVDIQKIETIEQAESIEEIEEDKTISVEKEVATPTPSSTENIDIDRANWIQEDFTKEYIHTQAKSSSKTTSVTTVSELLKSLSWAQWWEIIFLKSGIYEGVVIYGSEFNTNPVTLIWEKGTIIDNLKINHSQWLIIKNIDFSHAKTEWEEDWSRIVAINKSSNIIFEENRFTWSDDWDAFNDVTGLWIKISDNIVAYNNSFSWLSKWIVVDDSSDIIISDNNFSELNIDWVNVAGWSKDVLVEWNDFRDFYTCDIFDEEACKNHPDFVQVYNDTGEKSNENIRILSNTMIQWVGNSLQSIFIQTNNPGFDNKNITVANNLIYNSHSHGITFYNTEWARVYNNTLLQTLGSSANSINIPNINIFQSTWVKVEKNISISDIINEWSSLDVTESNSLISQGDYNNVFTINEEIQQRNNFYIKD